MNALRRILGALAVGSLLASVPALQNASAAGTFSCPSNGKAWLLAVGSASGEKGFLWSYPYSGASTDTLGTFSTRVKISSGWDTSAAVRAGANGFIWGFKPDGSLTAADWNVGATTFSLAPTAAVLPVAVSSAPWKAFATSTGRQRIAVDTSNSILVLDTSGRIRKYSYNLTSKTWPVWGKLVANVGSSYDMIWTSDANTIYARKTDGSFTRLRIDPGSDRVVTRVDGGGNGWGAFKSVSSAGGDTLYTVATAGQLKKYRYDDDTATLKPSLLLSSGTTWSSFLDVTTVGNTCVRNYAAETTLAPTVVDAPLEALGAQTTSIVGVGLANAVGTLQFATFDPIADTAGNLTWTDNNDGDSVTGMPALTTDSTDRFHLFSHTTAGLTKEKSQSAAGPGASLGAATNHFGVLAGPTDASRISDGTTVLAGADSNGAVWVRQEYSGVWSTWRQAATGALPSAPVTVTATAPGQATLSYPTSTGAVGTVVVTNGATVGTPVTLAAPGSGTSGRVAAMAYSGGALRLVVTDSGGALLTAAQDIATKAWSGWTELAAVGSTLGDPAVVLSPVSSRVQVVVRQGDGTIGIASETSQGSGTFHALSAIPEGVSGAMTSSPTTYTYTDPNGGTPVRRWGFVAYDLDRKVWNFSTKAATTSPTGRTADTEDGPLVSRIIGTVPTP